MLERAIIERKVDNYHYKVRIPSFNSSTAAIGSTSSSELYTATLSVSPGVAPSFKSGTAVCVLFESNDLSKPVIVGLLFNDTFDSTEADALFSSLDVQVNAKLPADTTIGDVTSESIASLENNTQNIAATFQAIDSFKQDTQTKLLDIGSNIDRLDTDIKRVDEKVDTHTHHELTSLQKLVFTSDCYGTEVPEGGEEGQIFFKLE